MLRLSLCAVVFLAACAKDPNPCAYGCISTFVEWEEGFGPADGQKP